MRISIDLQLDNDKMSALTDNPIYMYAEFIEVLRKHGFTHDDTLSIGFENSNSTVKAAKNAIVDATVKNPWIGDVVTSCDVMEFGKSKDKASLFKRLSKLIGGNKNED